MIRRRIVAVGDSQMLRLLSQKRDSVEFCKLFFEDREVLRAEKAGDDG